MEGHDRPELGPESVGEQLGFEGVESVVGKVEAYCGFEEQRIKSANQARITALQAELSLLAEEENELKERLREAAPPGDARLRKRKAVYSFVVAGVLTVAGFIFSVIAFDPFGFGWKSYVYCLGIAVVTPFCVDLLLEKWASERLIKTLITVSCVAAILSLVLLAVIRGDVLLRQLDLGSQTAVLDGSLSQEPAPAEDTFYKDTVPILRFVMALLALAMELGAGLALHNAQKLATDSGDEYEKLWQRLKDVHGQMVARVYEISTLNNESAVFVNRFWRDFYRAMIGHTIRNAIIKLLLLVLCVPLVCNGQEAPRERLNLVVAVDLSTSAAAAGYDGKTEFEKNLLAVTRLLGAVPPGSRITVLGITANSFSQPYIVLSARIPEDKGYFGERLAAARRQLLVAWQKQTPHLAPQARGTDILGALVVAGHLFHQTPNAERKILVLFSDMRQFTSDLNLEIRTNVPLDAAIEKAQRNHLVANLNGVEVHVLGVASAGMKAAQWNSVREFWAKYFVTTKSTLQSYSVLRDLPKLER